MNSRNLIVAALGAIVAFGSVSAASADSRWERHHPRREEVNNRLNNQNRRIHEERMNGEISGREARRLHMRDHAIRMTERRDAAMHGGHLTRGEQERLNARENNVSGAIGH